MTFYLSLEGKKFAWDSMIRGSSSSTMGIGRHRLITIVIVRDAIRPLLRNLWLWGSLGCIQIKGGGKMFIYDLLGPSTILSLIWGPQTIFSSLSRHHRWSPVTDASLGKKSIKIDQVTGHAEIRWTDDWLWSHGTWGVFSLHCYFDK